LTVQPGAGNNEGIADKSGVAMVINELVYMGIGSLGLKSRDHRACSSSTTTGASSIKRYNLLQQQWNVKPQNSRHYELGDSEAAALLAALLALVSLEDTASSLLAAIH
jgi:hypothetical protein